MREIEEKENIHESFDIEINQLFWKPVAARGTVLPESGHLHSCVLRGSASDPVAHPTDEGILGESKCGYRGDAISGIHL